MKKGIARLGIVCSFSLFTSPLLAASVSDLLITEVMVNPAALSDSAGEWFELYNPTDQNINLFGIELVDDGSNSHSFDSDLLILPGHFLTLARSGDPGFVPDYVYDDFVLSNSADEIVLRDGSVDLLRLEYGSGFGVAGRSRELSQLPMSAENYDLTLASLGYGAGDIGTPGSAGSVFPAPSAVPLPAAVWLFASGLLALFSSRIGRAACLPEDLVPTFLRGLSSVFRAAGSCLRVGFGSIQLFNSLFRRDLAFFSPARTRRNLARAGAATPIPRPESEIQGFSVQIPTYLATVDAGSSPAVLARPAGKPRPCALLTAGCRS